MSKAVDHQGQTEMQGGGRKYKIQMWVDIK